LDSRKEKRMKRLIHLTRVALAALALPGLALPCGAQQSSLDLVPFKAVMKSGLQPPVARIPGTTPLAVFIINLKGEADFLGPVDAIMLHPLQSGVDGKLLGVNDARGALTAANGDEIYFTYHGTMQPTATGAAGEFAFVVSGGKGRFAGATGSGFMKGVIDAPQNTGTMTIEAIISRPKP
jgi:hypothetical protein